MNKDFFIERDLNKNHNWKNWQLLNNLLWRLKIWAENLLVIFVEKKTITSFERN